MNWTALVLILCCLLAVFTTWKEYKRFKKRHLALRMIASLGAIIALAGIALPISYSTEVTLPDDHSAVLLTAGFGPDSLNSYNAIPVFTADRAVAKRYPKAKLVRLEELKIDSPAITRLHIFGYGLDAAELNDLGNLPVVFHRSPAPSGVTSISWNQKLRSGETLTIRGKYNNDRAQPVRLMLKGLSTVLDTALIPAKSSREFAMTTVPKNEGRSVYHLEAIAGTDTIAYESLPVMIAPIKPLKVLLLSASPDFETRFLKNWLSENGFPVAVRSIISKDKYSTEYVNVPSQKLDHLNDGLLDKFDVVIGDLSVLKSLSGTEAGALKEQVEQKGLGIIIRADSSSKAVSWLQSDFPVEKLNTRNTAPVALFIKNKTERSSPIKTDLVHIRQKHGTQVLVNDAANHILVSSSLAGAGRLVFTTVNTTFNWMLAGSKDDYTTFWSLLIGKAARKVTAGEEWSVQPQFPVPGMPVRLKLQSASAPLQVNAGQAVISPAQNPFIPFEWDNNYWPVSTGWQTIQQSKGQPDWWYVYNENEWQSARATERLATTMQYEANQAALASVTKPIHEKVQIEVPKIYFYLLLLISCAFLWMEGKSTPPNPLQRR